MTAFEDTDRIVLSIADDLNFADAIMTAASACGARVAGQVPLVQAPERLAMQARLHVVVLALEASDDHVAALALDAAANAARTHDAHVIASFGPEHIDLASAALDGVDAQLLCDPVAADLVTAFAMIAPPANCI